MPSAIDNCAISARSSRRSTRAKSLYQRQQLNNQSPGKKLARTSALVWVTSTSNVKCPSAQGRCQCLRRMRHGSGDFHRLGLSIQYHVEEEGHPTCIQNILYTHPASCIYIMRSQHCLYVEVLQKGKTGQNLVSRYIHIIIAAICRQKDLISL
jgi:hypothetical protein